MTRLKWYWTALLTLGAIAIAIGTYTLAVPKEPDLHGTALEDLPDVSHVTLTGTDGEPARLGDWSGKLLLIFFGYANCPDVCPLTMAQLSRTYHDLGEPEGLQVLMITVDPERDTPKQLENYVRGFHADFAGLTGTPSRIADASSRFYAASAARPGGEISHSSHVTLVDRQGRMRLIYNQDKIGPPLKDDLTHLLAQASW